MSGKFWTNHEVATLQRMLRERYAIEVIAKTVGRSRRSVSNKRDALRAAPWRVTQSPALEPIEAPSRIYNDHAKHLRLILETHRAGFPICGAGT